MKNEKSANITKLIWMFYTRFLGTLCCILNVIFRRRFSYLFAFYIFLTWQKQIIKQKITVLLL